MSLTLHFHPLSSFCWKALIALYENDTPFVPHMVDLGNEAERAALLKLWPIGKFPVLRDDAKDRTIPESSIIIEYLDNHYPGRTRFIPADEKLALQTRLRDRFYDLYVHLPMQKIVGDRLRPEGKKDPHGVEEARARLQSCYGMIDKDVAGQDLGDGRGFQHRRLRRVAGAVLCQQGDAVRRQPQKPDGLFRSPDGAAILCARHQGSGALFCHVPAGDVT